MFQKTACDFAKEHVAPIAAEMDAKGEVPFDNLQRMGELGFLGMTVPEEYGGVGADTVSYVLALEEISKACASTGAVMAVQNSLVNYGLVKFGTEEQRQQYLPHLATGEFIGSFALTEPGAGSDAAAQRTMAVRDSDSYVITGSKRFITSGGFASVVILFAMTDKEKGARGISAFLVEKSMPGFSVGKEELKMGIRATNTSELIFEECQVPAENRLGEEGQGFKIAMSILDAGRISIAAQACGIARAALEDSIEYAKTREQFGRPIGRFQAIQWMLADMATRIDASRLLIWRAALKKDRGERYSKEAAMAKLFASETAVWATNKGIQIHGGYGYMTEYPLERYYRDAKITELYEGTSEVQRLVIASWLLR
jgi:butyryl-CoA dehydrogenase